MAQTIKSISELKRVFQNRASYAARITRDEMFKVFQKHIDKFYGEYKPTVYKRTYKFLNSLIKTDITLSGNELSCSVRIDEKYLNYEYPYTQRFKPSYPHHYDGRFASGYDVASWANGKFPWDDYSGGKHGYTVDVGSGNGFWNDAIEELGGKQGIINLMKRNLKKCGVPVI